MSDFVYLKSAKAYVSKSHVSQVKPVFSGEVVASYDVIVDDAPVHADATIDGATVHNDILEIPADINHP